MRYRYYLWLLARLGVAVLLVGWAVSYLYPDSGNRELTLSLKALQGINEIHYTMVSDASRVGQHLEDEGDIVCSDNTMHRRQLIELNVGDRGFRQETEIVRVGYQDYLSQPEGLWKRGSGFLMPSDTPQQTCQRVKQSGTAWFIPEFERMAQHAVITKGDKKKLANGDVCREWKVVYFDGPVQMPQSRQQRTVCLGVDDHLPREMQDESTSTHWTYAFNLPIKIEAPTALVEEPQPKPFTPAEQQQPTLTLSSGDEGN